MKIDVVLKYVWLTVGVILLGSILTGIFFVFGLSGGRGGEQGVTVDNSKKEKLEKVNLELSYSSPVNLGNSDNYMLNVYVSYKESESTLKAGFDSYSKDMDVNQPSNIIFLDKNLIPIRTLFDQKALVTEVYYPQEADNNDGYNTNADMKYILYQVVLFDTDEDGQLGSEDVSDLYISKLDGSGLTRITKGLTLENIDFLDKYETILIRYHKADFTDAYATYSITKKELTDLNKVSEAIKAVKEILIK
jgi:hypothetical protein